MKELSVPQCLCFPPSVTVFVFTAVFQSAWCYKNGIVATGCRRRQNGRGHGSDTDEMGMNGHGHRQPDVGALLPAAMMEIMDRQAQEARKEAHEEARETREALKNLNCNWQTLSEETRR
ncbi:hypothetical protein E2C01_021549 [Portunus trituberculatus]|uniref:Uncharacterized protein n=1 Tax=Portunus trituberculatus TaxID=210409 RepID=A0A5B7E4S5_PORTR|nr:hypothetical protein [Portunus trituberculatus]